MKTNSDNTRRLGQPPLEAEDNYYFVNERYAELVRRGEANYWVEALKQQAQPGTVSRLSSRLVAIGRALAAMFIG